MKFEGAVAEGALPIQQREIGQIIYDTVIQFFREIIKIFDLFRRR